MDSVPEHSWSSYFGKKRFFHFFHLYLISTVRAHGQIFLKETDICQDTKHCYKFGNFWSGGIFGKYPEKPKIVVFPKDLSTQNGSIPREVSSFKEKFISEKAVHIASGNFQKKCQRDTLGPWLTKKNFYRALWCGSIQHSSSCWKSRHVYTALYCAMYRLPTTKV